MTPLEALKTYFGYDDFRPLQAEIINSVLSGNDTLALMPTGGGKSLCFQIPALVQEGLCLVVSPLIALMKDQVENLRKRGISAAAIYTGMTSEQQRIAFDNCLFGPFRCLYVSPERLESEAFRKRLVQLPVTLIAVDEAHCISEWGYDFRPSYLNIAAIRNAMPPLSNGQPVPILALTATAIPDVVDDIQGKLAFRAPCVLKKSFARANLSYIVRYCRDMEEKMQQLQHILSSVAGSAIVYVRNRKRAEELAERLHATFYHAGLDPRERARRQEAWKKTSSTMVCTNAFGMGIDKPDVRLVIHVDLPDTVEAYFQEAGRAGRDEKPAYAVLLYAPDDQIKARKRARDNYPDKALIETIYHKTCDFLEVGAGSGYGHSFTLHMEQLISAMHLPLLQTYSALHLLTQAGYIRFEEEQETQPRVMLLPAAHDWQQLDLSEEQKDLLQHLMRTYTGIFTELQYIHDEITTALHRQLADLAARHILTYVPRTRASRLTFTQDRQTDIRLPIQVYDMRLNHYMHKLQAMLNYARNTQLCRSQALLTYFGEYDAPPCGTCDICRAQRTSNETR